MQRDIIDNVSFGQRGSATGSTITWPDGNTWTKIATLAPMQLDYGFQILSELQVRATTAESNTINSRLGNMNTEARNSRKNNSDNLGIFTSTPYLSHEGETVYLSSSSLSGHAGVLPSGQKSCIARISVLNDYSEVAHSQAELDKSWVDCGGLSLRTLRFSLRDHTGQLLDLGDRDYSAQLVFGFPPG